MGVFGEGIEEDALLHVEFFADESWKEAIDLSLHGAHFIPLTEDISGSLRVTDRNLLKLMRQSRPAELGRRGFLFPKQEVARSDIQRFYESEDNEEARLLFRKAISRHVSEWSDQVDWVRTLSEAQEWDEAVKETDRLLRDEKNRYREGIFSGELRKILPFIWLTQEVAEHIGLDVKDWTEALPISIRSTLSSGCLLFIEPSSSRLQREKPKGTSLI